MDGYWWSDDEQQHVLMYLISGTRVIGNGSPIVKEDVIERISDVEYRCDGDSSTGHPFSGRVGDDGVLYIDGRDGVKSCVRPDATNTIEFLDVDEVKHQLIFKEFRIEYHCAGTEQPIMVRRVICDFGRMRLTLNDATLRLELESRDVLERARAMKALQDRFNLRRAGFFFLQVARLRGNVPLASWCHPSQVGERSTQQLQRLPAQAVSIRPAKGAKHWSALKGKLQVAADAEDKLIAALYLLGDYPEAFAQELLQEALALAHTPGLGELWRADGKGEENGSTDEDSGEELEDPAEDCLQAAIGDQLDDLLDKFFDVKDILITVVARDDAVSATSAVTGDVVVEMERASAITFGDVRGAIASRRSCPRAAVKLLSGAGEVLDAKDDEEFAPAPAAKVAEAEAHEG